MISPREAAVIAELFASSNQRRLGAVQQLSEEARPEHLPLLFAALNDRSPDVRRRSVDALVGVARGHEGSRGTIRRVLEGLLVSDRSARVKSVAAAAMDTIHTLRASGPCVIVQAPVAPRRVRRAPPRTVVERTRRPEGEECQRGPEEILDEYDEGCRCGEPSAWEWSPLTGDLPALGEVDALVRRFHERMHPGTAEGSPPRLGNVVRPEVFARLRAALRPAPLVEVPAEIASLAQRRGVSLPMPTSVDSLDVLALRALQRLHQIVTPAEIDWEAIGSALEAALRRPPGSEEDNSAGEAVVLAFHEAAFAGPEELRERLAMAPWASGWLPLGPWLAGALRLGDTRELVARSRGSWLALENLRGWLGDRRRKHMVIDCDVTSGAGVGTFPQVMAAGGGSLQSMEYPEFRVVSRASLVELSSEQAVELRAIGVELGLMFGALSAPGRGIEALLAKLGGAFWAALAPEARGRLLETLRRSVIACLALRAEQEPGARRLRRAQLVSFWERPLPGGVFDDVDRMRRLSTADRLLEALALALLSEVHQPYSDDEDTQRGLKELLIEAARMVSALHGWEPLPLLVDGDMASAAAMIDALLRCFEHAPLELAQACGLDPRQGLPRLQGGQVGALEARFRAVYRRALRGRRKTTGDGVTLVCRPIPKAQALYRGELGRDCSSRSVPLRALSPHHVYYGLFDEGGVQLPGYLTVFEAWSASEEGVVRPVLCLETINEPRGLLGGVQQDLLLIFEAIARSRGLDEGLVLITHQGTWNYANGHELAGCRRARRATRVWLAPADPVVWRAYALTSGEGGHYTAFGYPAAGELLRPVPRSAYESMPLLAPFDPAVDRVQPENAAEAARLQALPAGRLRVTCRGSEGEVLGFVSSGA